MAEVSKGESQSVLIIRQIVKTQNNLPPFGSLILLSSSTMNSEKKSTLKQIILVVCLIPLLALTAWWGYQVYSQSNERSDIKDDYMEANSIMHGIFSVNNWREEFKNIITNQIEEFDLTPKQDSILRVQINSLLNSMITEAKNQVKEDDKTLGKKIRRWAINTVVDWENLRERVPGFTESIVEDLTSEESKERLKIFALDKFNEYADQIYDDTLTTYLQSIYTKYDLENQAAFNEYVVEQTDAMEDDVNQLALSMLAVVGFFLLLWALAYKFPELRKPLFFMSVLLALIVLVTGLASPMIEIDARINKVDFVLLGEHIYFDNQMIFYRSKSILQVVSLLFQSPRIDSKMVGFLVLAFSVILPISKLISTQIYLLGKGALRKNKIIQWLAFKSGKWSMADVMVVAIFMSYVSFDGILDHQLEYARVETETLTSLATNLTSLQPGFMLFLTYVLYGLILAAILGKISPKPGEVESK
ncbi:paraquat-inducible protein A [Owenweeksia hongkongensis]|uniref:paraquat-inducible protein A n=1 Tax=Owenweeksia hongkongensis TaxID=253245 RepID=UPI003A8E7613